MTILVTGGAGYIGSHTSVELIQSGFEIVILDNFSNSSELSIRRVEEITGKKIQFYEADLLDKEALKEVFERHQFSAVIHFAALKAVGESVKLPLRYYENNIIGTINLLETMKMFGVSNFVFSSSATVYGDPVQVPIKETFATNPTNPYGWTKLMTEQILRDVQLANPDWNVILLRYFNPVGAHSSGKIGEAPNGIPNNLMPYISQVAVGKLPELQVFGDDYPTDDGTGVRDYIHVVDLAKGHVSALEKLNENPGLEIYNLGTGKGYSVLELIHAFSKVIGRKIPYRVVGRRAGDIATCFADPEKANRELHWKAIYDIDQMCEDTWRWQSMNPEGFAPTKVE
ncbi:UDP-glucose 4-epimerase GalE [bacterium]|nr:UDP-glucose 4-epimerase GalE [bacterium]